MNEPADIQRHPREGAITRVLDICNKKGLHARASAKFVQIVDQFDAVVKVTRGAETVGGNSIMGLMMLAAGTARRSRSRRPEKMRRRSWRPWQRSSARALPRATRPLPLQSVSPPTLGRQQNCGIPAACRLHHPFAAATRDGW